MSNSDTLKGQWKQIKGEVRRHWGRFTDDEVEEMKGERQHLLGKVQEKYGLAKDEAEDQLAEFLKKVKDKLS